MTNEEQLCEVIKSKLSYDDSWELVNWRDEAGIVEDGKNGMIVKWKSDGTRTLTFSFKKKEARP